LFSIFIIAVMIHLNIMFPEYFVVKDKYLLPEVTGDLHSFNIRNR
jgi:hypothetical protein